MPTASVAANAKPTNAASGDEESAATDLLALASRPVALQLRAGADVPTPLPATARAEPEQPAPARQSRFYVGVVAGPDISTVKFASVQSPLPNLGIILEYRITDRLRLTSGLLRSTKQYTARRDDYDWGAYRSMVYRYDFEEVEGACTVLDVPLNLRYDLVVRPQYRVFGSAGLSTFFMQRERYAYTWKQYNRTYAWERSVVNENRHLFSILNLSVGLERRLSDRWSVQAEPYAKLPLAGVGAGKVRLASGGVFFGVKYGL